VDWLAHLLICLLCVATTTSPISGVEAYEPIRPDPLLEPWRWTSFPELKGMGLRCIAEGTDGCMWFGVNDGVLGYDGLTWRPYTPADGLHGVPVNALASAPDGSIYAGTPAGISRFADGVWHRVWPTTPGLKWNVRDLAACPDGRLLAATDWGALFVSGDKATVVTTAAAAGYLTAAGAVSQAVIAPPEICPRQAWGEGVGAQTIGGVTINLADRGSGAAAGLQIGDRVVAMDGKGVPDRTDLGGPAGTEVTLTVIPKAGSGPRDVQVVRDRVDGSYATFGVYDVLLGSEGEVWLGLDGGQVLAYDSRQSHGRGAQVWRAYTASEGLSVGRSPRLAQTRDGAVWVVCGDPRAGISRIAPPEAAGKQVTTWTGIEPGELDIHTSVLETSDGVLWVGGGHSIYARQGGAWTPYGAAEGNFPNGRVVDLIETSTGHIWLAGKGLEAARLDYCSPKWTTYTGLNFECETPDGSQWFVEPEKAVVRSRDGAWTRYDVQDGLMVEPLGVTTAAGDAWATGSHKGSAAAARFGGGTWSLEVHPELGPAIGTGVFEASNGVLWVGGMGAGREAGPIGGLLRRDGEAWSHLSPVLGAPRSVYGIGEMADGTIWVGGPSGLSRYDGSAWSRVTDPWELTEPSVDRIHTGPDGKVWVGTRNYGVYRHDGVSWSQCATEAGLEDYRITGLLQTREGATWTATNTAIFRFDGYRWYASSALRDLAPMAWSLSKTSDGAMWINYRYWGPAGSPPRVIRHEPDRIPPETVITLSMDPVPYPGNALVTWRGSDPWRMTPEEDLSFAWRLDGGEWGAFRPSRSEVLLALPVGSHAFEVTSRDGDFNVDPSPAVVHFTVIPPVWRQPWFGAIMAILLAAIAVQTTRVLRRDRRLRRTNASLVAEMAERDRLDARLQELGYLYRLRTALTEARTPEAVITAAGNAVTEVLSAVDSGGAVIEFDGRKWQFGTLRKGNVGRYEHDLAWADKPRGQMRLSTPILLSDSQQRTLLDETAGQIEQALESRELEMQLLQSARLVSLGEMSAAVAHELGQPLTVISTTAGDVYQRQIEGLDLPADRLKQMMNTVLSMVARMDETVNHLRVFSRDTAQEGPVAFSLNECIRNALRMMGTQLENHGIAVNTEFCESLPEATGHPHQLEQVVLNLLSNARDALDDRKSTEKDPGWRKHLEIRTREGDGDGLPLVAEVSDNGVGIDEGEADRVFDPFYTTKQADSGTGLGLSISYAIVRDHGGRITCESCIGEGTTFRVELPQKQ
jgi:signal transduction histidine kinase/ligand-binding sensor domain-containing protein